VALTYTTTIYTRHVVPVTKYVVTRYRLVSEVVTTMNVDYYDDAGNLWTRISYPTRYLKNVRTLFLGVEERPGVTEREVRRRPVPEPVPTPPGAMLESAREEVPRAVRVSG